jgi:SAM-dependent methyltransferase
VDTFGHPEEEYRAWLDPILERVPPRSAVLDLGSGTGIPAARILARRFRVTGVDISDLQVRRARRLVPRARFVRADLSDVDFPPGAFAAVISLYALIHVPREEHREMLRKVARWLVPGGWFLTILGHGRYEGAEPDWLGSNARMLWSHYDAATYRRWFRAEGYRIVQDRFIPEGKGGHHLFLAQSARRSPAPPGQ